jgi:hypothetical protein
MWFYILDTHVELRRIFGTNKIEKASGGQRKLSNEELYNLYSSPYIL